MKIHKIAQVRIDETGSLYVKPVEGDFAHIYRAAMEVNWSSNQLALFSPKPREWSYARCFQQIVTAVEQEYGVNLVLTPSTEWREIPDSLRHEIEELSKKDD
jgi:hypothetical protein